MSEVVSDGNQTANNDVIDNENAESVRDGVNDNQTTPPTSEHKDESKQVSDQTCQNEKGDEQHQSADKQLSATNIAADGGTNQPSEDDNPEEEDTQDDAQLTVDLPPSKLLDHGSDLTVSPSDKPALQVQLPPIKNPSLRVELPPTDKDLENTELKVPAEPSSTSDDSPPAPTDAAAGATAGNSGTGSRDGDVTDPSESLYHIKWTQFKKKLVPIITQNENGPCPLLAIMNILLLQNRVKLAGQSEYITAGQLMALLGDCVLKNVPNDEGVSTPARLNFEHNMQDAMAVMYKLQTGLDVNIKFTGVRDFEYTNESIIFDILQMSLYHGWLVDPQNTEESQAVGKLSYNLLVEKIITHKTSDETDLISQALVAEQFLERTASQLTYHGLSELSSQLKEEELAVLFRNNHFTTLYKHKNELFQLVTDQGFLTENDVVWETLSNVEGDCHFVDSDFRTYTKPEPALHALDTSPVAVNSTEQIDQDFLVALSLQQEQQQEQYTWPQVDPQQPPPPQMSDLELAQSLQEEERQRANAEANTAQRSQQGAAPRQHQGAARNPAPAGQRRPARGEQGTREEKKSDNIRMKVEQCGP